MSTHSTADPGGPGFSAAAETESARALTALWWLWLITGTGWLIIALVVLQFDDASITTVGVIIGCMFLAASAQQLVYALFASSMRWLWGVVSVLYFGAGVLCLLNPEDTFAGLADILGFLFLIVGVWWTIEAFIERDTNPVWWLILISGVLMTILAFWTSGQFFIEKTYVLLVFAGIWALMHGVTDYVKAFQVRRLRDEL